MSLHVLKIEEIVGPVNYVSLQPVKKLEFSRAMAGFYPGLWFFLNTVAVLIALEEMGNELLFASSRVEPSGMKISGYAFQHYYNG